MIHQPGADDLAAWQNFSDAFLKYSEASRALFSPGVDRVALVSTALDRGQKTVVAKVLPHLKPDELKQLFPILVEWCSVGHAVVHHFREAVKSLPRDWVLDRIEAVAEPLLAAGSDEEYRRLLELYRELDRGLTERLARRAAEHKDPDISEAGRDFLELLDEADAPDHATPPPDGPAGEQPRPRRPGRRLLDW